MDELLTASELMYLYAPDVIPGVRGKPRATTRRRLAGHQKGDETMTTETETNMPLLYICHNRGQTIDDTWTGWRTVTFCEAYAADGVLLFRFDADTADDEGILAAMTADPDRAKDLAEKFPDGYDTALLGGDKRLPQDVWENHVRRSYDPRLWEGVGRQIFEGTFGPIDDEQEETFLTQLIEGGSF